jgi:hypothetical protein
MENRGSAFVWPDTLRKFVVSEAKTQVFLYAIEQFKAVAVAEAERALEWLLLEDVKPKPTCTLPPTKVMKMKITWIRQQVQQQGRKKPVEADVGSIPDYKNRFFLHNSGGKMIPTMWTLYDSTTEIQWFLNGSGWEGARKAAESTIVRELGKNPLIKPVSPVKVKKPKKLPAKAKKSVKPKKPRKTV